MIMSNNLFDVSDTIVLISGGSRGIGFSIAEGFAAQGAKVIITGREEATLKAACAGAKPATHAITYSVCDVSDKAMIEACVDDVVAKHGRIDTLVNCAGVNRRVPAIDFSEEDYDFIMDTNLRGAFFMSQAVGKQMIAQGNGNQINIDSLSTYAPLTNVTPYSMGKTAMSAMTKGLAQEWGKHGVRINGLAPGFILTDLTKALWSKKNMQEWNKTVAPLQRLGEPDDMIGTAIFLASPAASFISGQIIRVDGGISAGLNWPIDDDFEITNK